MDKKRINKIKILKQKQRHKQRQKQMQIVNVNIHKPTRKPREGPKKNVSTPQYNYTSQNDSLVPQIFNKQESLQKTLSEQINKSLEEKLNKIISTQPTPTQLIHPTQQEIRQIRTAQFEHNKPNNITNISPPIDFFISPTNDLKPDMQPNYNYERSPIKPNIEFQTRPNLYKSEPETLQTIIQKPRTNIKKDGIDENSNIYIPKEKKLNDNDNDLIISENTIPFVPSIFNQQPDINNLQLVLYKKNNLVPETDLIDTNEENKKLKKKKYDAKLYKKNKEKEIETLESQINSINNEITILIQKRQNSKSDKNKIKISNNIIEKQNNKQIVTDKLTKLNNEYNKLTEQDIII